MRKRVVSSVVLVLITLGWGDHSLAEQAPEPRGELRVVDTHPWNWVWITMNVMEHLIEFEPHGKLVPRLATGWR